MPDYKEMKKAMQKAINKVKVADLERGRYLEKNIKFDDAKEGFTYTGDEKTMQEILSRVQFED